MGKEELMQYKTIKVEIKQLKERIKELEERKTSIKSQVITDMPTGNGEGTDILSLIVMIEDAETELIQKEKQLIATMNKIEHTIDNVENSLDRCILRARYIECKAWEQICVELNYSWRQIHRLHSNILKKIA
ncbi:DUF1492 domain-containing protein [Intestinibacter bartlettii]|jgi:hypothetical protein|uniref:DUF1492 domain-containing protein n=1 Tax=Intestinibacter bartlettii TaxID=261299 RepID=UPI002676B4F2|nr:DUF1492 domain-containing protein [Intestinibacter bartlettii]